MLSELIKPFTAELEAGLKNLLNNPVVKEDLASLETQVTSQIATLESSLKSYVDTAIAEALAKLASAPPTPRPETTPAA